MELLQDLTVGASSFENDRALVTQHLAKLGASTLGSKRNCKSTQQTNDDNWKRLLVLTSDSLQYREKVVEFLVCYVMQCEGSEYMRRILSMTAAHSVCLKQRTTNLKISVYPLSASMTDRTVCYPKIMRFMLTSCKTKEKISVNIIQLFNFQERLLLASDHRRIRSKHARKHAESVRNMPATCRKRSKHAESVRNMPATIAAVGQARSQVSKFG